MKTIFDLNMLAVLAEVRLRDALPSLFSNGDFDVGQRIFLSFHTPHNHYDQVCIGYPKDPIKFYMGLVSPDWIFTENEHQQMVIRTPDTYGALHYKAIARVLDELKHINTPVGKALYLLALCYVPYCVAKDPISITAVTTHPVLQKVYQSLVTNLNDPDAPLVDYDVLNDNQNKLMLGRSTDKHVAELLRMIHMTTNPRGWTALLKTLVFSVSPTVMASSWRAKEIRDYLAKKSQHFRLGNAAYNKDEVLDMMLSNLMFILRSAEQPYTNPEKAHFTPGIKERLMDFARRAMLDHEEFCELADLLIGYMCCAHSHNSHVKYHFALLEALD